MADQATQRDKQVTRYIHRLFWRAILHNKFYFSLTALLHAPFFFINAVFMPLQIAYGLQAIITNQFDKVPHYAIVILIASVIANVLMTIATWAFNRNGIFAVTYVRKAAFSNYLEKDYSFFADNYVGALGVQAARFGGRYV
jgi:hypothetical protein